MGCIEVYREGGSYLELRRFADVQDTLALVDALHEPLDNGELAPHAEHEWAEFAAQALDVPVEWREIGGEEMEVYQALTQPEVASHAIQTADLDF